MFGLFVARTADGNVHEEEEDIERSIVLAVKESEKFDVVCLGLKSLWCGSKKIKKHLNPMVIHPRDSY